jgi:hypothetical protein
MATSFDVNIKLGSSMGFNMGGGVTGGYAPQMQTIRTLDGDTSTQNLSYDEYQGPVLQVDPIDDFILSATNTSSKHAVVMHNIGNAVLTVTDLLFTFLNDIKPILYFNNTDTLINNSVITISPRNSSTFSLAYTGNVAGFYDNALVIKSNNSTGPYYKIPTHQIVQITSSATISPASFTTTTTQIGKIENVIYNITPIINEYVRNDIALRFTTTFVTNSTAWTYTTGTNSATATFNPWEINNVNGTYISTLTIVANNITSTLTNTAIVNLNHTLNKNLATWTSPLSVHNSVIGISYDLENGNRVLTIGVSMGGNGTPIVENGFNYSSILNLGIGTDALPDPYPTWANVCRIEFTGLAQTYLSNDYMVKRTLTKDYMKYFGEYDALGSMFIIKDDGYGSLTIELNHLRALSDDSDFNVTLQNLTRAFYYYSSVDTLGRIAIQSAEYSSSIDALTTYLFTGFNYNNKDKLAVVNTTVVELPVADI